jgi:hypothetical protein
MCICRKFPGRKHGFKHFFFCCVSTLSSEGSITVPCLRSCCLAMASCLLACFNVVVQQWVYISQYLRRHCTMMFVRIHFWAFWLQVFVRARLNVAEQNGKVRGGIKTPWAESTNKLHRPSDQLLSAKLVPTFADRRCVVSATDPQGLYFRFSRSE